VTISEPVGQTTRGQRAFTVEFKLEFLQQWDQCLEWGSKTRLMREYAVSSSTVVKWRRARDRGEFEASMLKASGEARWRVDNRDRAELKRLREENALLKAKVTQAEAAQEILGKAFELLEGITKSSTDPNPRIPPALMSAEQYRVWLERTTLS
jgi:transposase-like protein